MIGVTGATGQLGLQVLKHLQQFKPAATRVRALTRHPEQAAGLVAYADEIRRADFGDPKILATAFEGIDTLLLVSIEGEDEMRLRLHTQAATAAARAGVKRIVYTSFFDVAPDSPSVVARVHRLTEDAIRQSGCAWTMLRNGPYVDNIARRVAQAARHGGVFRMAAGDTRMPFIARSDLAEAAARALVSQEAGNTAYRLSGAELLSYQALADLVGAALDATVRYQSISDEDYLEELRAEDLAPGLQTRRIAYVQSMRQGFMTALTSDFERLVGRPPCLMRDVVPRIDLDDDPTH